MALKRLNHLKRRLDNDKDLYEKYDEKIKEHQRKGYAKMLSPEEASTTTPLGTYLITPFFILPSQTKFV